MRTFRFSGHSSSRKLRMYSKISAGRVDCGSFGLSESSDCVLTELTVTVDSFVVSLLNLVDRSVEKRLTSLMDPILKDKVSPHSY